MRCCVSALEYAFGEIDALGDVREYIYDIYCAACVKEFELVLEQSGKLLRKHLPGVEVWAYGSRVNGSLFRNQIDRPLLVIRPPGPQLDKDSNHPSTVA